VLFEGYSSGSSRAQGPITKTGNGHARRLLVEAAWHHRPRYQPGKTIRDRWELASPTARARGDLGNRRLHARWVKYIDRKKKATVANTAIAASSPAGGGRWPCSRSNPTISSSPASLMAARGANPQKLL
jgi:hypothetical protein